MAKVNFVHWFKWSIWEM